MVFDLVTTVESVERRPDGTHIVEVGLDQGVMVPREVQKLRGRGLLKHQQPEQVI